MTGSYSIIQKMPERDFQFLTCLFEAEKCVKAFSAILASGGPADFAPFDKLPDVPFGKVILKREFRFVQNPEQL